ncbi:MAG: hypothetical protein PVG12_03215 [Gammaproteobacteria bacterium]|jgi:hypothetical protein
MTRFRAKPILNDSRLALIAIESLEYRHNISESGYWLYGTLKPVAVIVCNTDGTNVLGVEEGLADIQLLIEEVPELESIIASLSK